MHETIYKNKIYIVDEFGKMQEVDGSMITEGTKRYASKFELTGAEALEALKKGAVAKRKHWTVDDGIARAVKDFTGEYHVVYTEFDGDPLDNIISFENGCLPKMGTSVNAGEFLHDDWGILCGWGDVPVKQPDPLVDLNSNAD